MHLLQMLCVNPMVQALREWANAGAWLHSRPYLSGQLGSCAISIDLRTCIDWLHLVAINAGVVSAGVNARVDYRARLLVETIVFGGARVGHRGGRGHRSGGSQRQPRLSNQTFARPAQRRCFIYADRFSAFDATICQVNRPYTFGPYRVETSRASQPGVAMAAQILDLERRLALN